MLIQSKKVWIADQFIAAELEIENGKKMCIRDRVRVDVNLADCRSGSLTQLILRNTDSILQSSAVLVDDLYILLRYAGSAVKNDRESRDLLLDLMQDIETKLRLRCV